MSFPPSSTFPPHPVDAVRCFVLSVRISSTAPFCTDDNADGVDVGVGKTAVPVLIVIVVVVIEGTTALIVVVVPSATTPATASIVVFVVVGGVVEASTSTAACLASFFFARIRAMLLWALAL